MSREAGGDKVIYGYSRISSATEEIEREEALLAEAGCEAVVVDRWYGGKRRRPELDALAGKLGPGDVLVVTRLARLSASVADLLHLLERVTTSGAGFRSLDEGIDSTVEDGRMMVRLVAALAELARATVRERAPSALGGRRPKLTLRQRERAVRMIRSGATAASVARAFGVHPSTISREIARANEIDRRGA